MAVSNQRTRRDEDAELTRKALLDAAQVRFAESGYEATGIEEIVQDAGVTRGALYHHFADKRALFEEVVIRLQTEVATSVELRARKVPNVWTRLETGFGAYLDACSAPAFRQIVILDAPSVLGAARFREIDEANSHRLLAGPLRSMQDAGHLELPDVRIVSRLIAAMMWESATMLAEPKSGRRVREQSLAFITQTLRALKKKRTTRMAAAA